MDIVQTDIPVNSALTALWIRRLTELDPAFSSGLLGRTAYQRPLFWLRLGTGPRKVLFSAGHHANEWLTVPVLMKYAQELARAAREKTDLAGTDAAALLEAVTFVFVPLMDPDGTDLVTGAIGPDSPQYASAQRIARGYPAIPFPSGWKANLLGVDLNLNYPADWQEARKIKQGLGYISPAPRDYVGRSPFDQMETRALGAFTRQEDPALVVALHTQGQVIYWQYRDIFVEGAEELGRKMAEKSGYVLADVPYVSSFAGYKDWFIQEFRRPGYTLELGQGVNPLPLSQFPAAYEAAKQALTAAALG